MHPKWLSNTRTHLADASSMWRLSLLGICSGVCCALITFLFRYFIDTPSALWLPDNNPENFEALPSWLHFGLPLMGATLIGLILRKMNQADTRTGIAHVITRVHAYHGHLPLKNALVQFFGGAIAIATGQSAGREGPAIHLGAAANSLVGQWLKLPNNSIRLLVGCGTSAAIAASFNTPIAGVIFAMEVIMMEYSVAGFIPVLLATVTATIMTRAIYGSEALFAIPLIEIPSLWEVPYIALLGLFAGCCAALFIGILKAALRYNAKPILTRMVLAGLITGSCAMLLPEIMGLGYDTLNAAVANQLSITLLLALIAAKIIATAASTGLGMPIGLIGPSLVIGACIGSAFSNIGAELFPTLQPQNSFYVLLGMGAMMGAILNAPLAALMALLELSSSTTIIFPGMLAITIACLSNSEIFKQQSAHQTILQFQKQLLLTDPLSLALQRTSVASIMQRSIKIVSPTMSCAQAKQLLTNKIDWYLIKTADNNHTAIHSNDLHAAIESISHENTAAIDLLDISNKTQSLTQLYIQATLKEALLAMNKNNVDTLYVSDYSSGPYINHGIVTRADIDTYSNKPQLI